MPFRFSTEHIPARDRFEAWEQTINSACSPRVVEYGVSAIAFHGELEARTIGGMTMVRVAQNTAASRRGQREIEQTDPTVYYLILQVGGGSRVTQAGAEAVLRPGTMTLIDSGLPCQHRYGGDSVNLNLHLPRRLLEARRGTARLPLATTLATPAAHITGELMQTVYRCAAEHDAGTAPGVIDALLSLACASLFGEDLPPADDRSMGERVRAYIFRHLDDPTLSPATIAAEFGMSVRHLHRLFEPAGQTVSDWIRQARLERCASDLRDARQRGISLTEICYRWGFNDSAHFSRAFKAGFGQAPKRYRSANLPV